MASRIIDGMNTDPNVNACDDFYEYACGNFFRTHDLSQHVNTINTETLIRTDLNSDLRAILEAIPEKLSNVKPFKLTQQLYDACTNRELIDQYSYMSQNEIDDAVINVEDDNLRFLKSITNINDKWPVLTKGFPVDNFNWMNALSNLVENGFNMDYLMKFSISINPRDTSDYIITIDHPTFVMPKEYFKDGLRDLNVQKYHTLMVDIVELFNVDRASVERQMEGVIALETSIVQAALNNEKQDQYGKYYLTNTTIRQLDAMMPNINYLKLLTDYLKPNIKVNSNQTVIVYGIDYFKQLDRIIGTTEATDMANLIYWKTVLQSLPYLSGKFYWTYHAYMNFVTGRTLNEPTWIECVESTKKMLPIGLGALYAQNYYSERNEDFRTVDDITAGIIRAFKNLLSKNPFVTQEQADNIYDKFEAVIHNNGFPYEFYSNAKLTEYYQHLNIWSGLSYLQMILEINKFNSKTFIALLKENFDNFIWTARKDFFDVNYLYDTHRNTINIPENVLHGTYFSNTVPNYINYGALGTKIAHGIYYSLNQKDALVYDEYGHYSPWRINDFNQGFFSHHQCLVDYYQEFRDPEYTACVVNGERTLYENLADNVAVQVAYTAFSEWLNETSTKQVVTGLTRFTPGQIFWLSYANLFCSKSIRDEKFINGTYQHGTHVPAKFRVLGPLMNMEAFTRDFNCSDTSKMIPLGRCRIF